MCVCVCLCVHDWRGNAKSNLCLSPLSKREPNRGCMWAWTCRKCANIFSCKLRLVVLSTASMVIQNYFVCFELELIRAQAMLSLSSLMKNQKQVAHSHHLFDTFDTLWCHSQRQVVPKVMCSWLSNTDFSHKDRQCPRSCVCHFQTLISNKQDKKPSFKKITVVCI